MPGKNCEIRIGASGWHYRHWQRRFYPDNLPKSKWLEYYARHFDTVEVNNTFYQLPKDKTFEDWYAKAPPGFLYTLKANRFITHIKRLTDAGDSLMRFVQSARLLKDKLGPILYQLPPSLQKDLSTLRAFCRLLQDTPQAFFEFRHKTWYCRDVYDLLESHGVGFCIHDLGGLCAPRVITAKKMYLRFHGTTGRNSARYTKARMQSWADWIHTHRNDVTQVYAYFNNDANAYAIDNAKTLRDMITTGLPVAATPRA